MEEANKNSGLTRLPLRAGAFVALVCVAIIALSGYRESAARGGHLRAAEAQLDNLARSLMQQAEDSFDLLDTGIVGIVSRLETDGTGAATLSKLGKVMSARKASLDRIYNIVILDEKGNFIATTGSLGPNLGDRDFFRHHLQSDSPGAFVGPPIRSKINGQWISTISRRFNRPDGSFGGVVFASIEANYFSKLYRQFDVGSLGSIGLMKADGLMIARSLESDSWAGRNLANTILFRDPLYQGASGTFNYKSPLDNVWRVAAYRRSDRFPLVMLASRQMDEVLAPWRSAAATRMLFVLGLVVVIAVLGLHLVRQLSRGQRLAAELVATEANFRVLAEGSSDIVGRLALDLRVQYASPSTVRIIGWRPDQLVGTNALAGINPDDLPLVEQTIAALKCGEIEEGRLTYRTRHREKSEIWVETSMRPTRTASGEIDGFIVVSRDITQQKDLESKLETLATEDGLTGIANRRRFDQRLQDEWARAYRERTCVALLMIDLDNFKPYNDRYGHPAGDECLRMVAGILAEEAQRSTDLAVRYGGEEFAMLLPNTDAAGCARIGERIRRSLRQKSLSHELNPPSHLVTASIGGATCWPGIERSAVPASLIEAADRALYAAKAAGRDRLVMGKQSISPLLLASVAQ